MESPLSAIQRGVDNVIANWPLLLIRIAENVALIALVVIAILGVLVPMGLFGGFGHLEDLGNLETPVQVAEALTGPFLTIFLYLFAVMSIAILLAIIVHSFVQGGVVGCYVEGERQARTSSGTHRGRFKTFTPDKWFGYAKRDWWPIFLIYNVTWGIFGLLLLVPLIALAALIFAWRESEQVVVLSCLGLLVIFLFLFVGGFVVHLWSTAAIVLRSTGRATGQALRDGWRTMIQRALPLVGIAVIALVVSFAAAASIGFASFGVGMISSIPGVGFFTLPAQLGISFVQTAVSVVVYAWFLAAAVSVVLQ